MTNRSFSIRKKETNNPVPFNLSPLVDCSRRCTEDVPPTIVFGLPAGSAAVEPSGTLAVFPGSILHLECLFARKLGNPEWTWNSTFRQYLTGKSFRRRLRYGIKYRVVVIFLVTCLTYTRGSRQLCILCGQSALGRRSVEMIWKTS